MPPRILIIAICSALCLTAVTLAASARQFEELWRRGAFVELGQLLAGYDAFQAQSRDELETAARAAFEIRDYRRGAELYGTSSRLSWRVRSTQATRLCWGTFLAP